MVQKIQSVIIQPMVYDTSTNGVMEQAIHMLRQEQAQVETQAAQ